MALRDIFNEDNMAGLFKNLRFDIFASPCNISKVALKNFPNEDKTAGFFKNLNFVIYHGFDQVDDLCIDHCTIAQALKKFEIKDLNQHYDLSSHFSKQDLNFLHTKSQVYLTSRSAFSQTNPKITQKYLTVLTKKNILP